MEGELWGLLWALEKTRFWTLGCPDLILFTDHKPLVGLVRTVNLDLVGNPGLLRMLERMLRWRFSATHVPGEKNMIPDALSCYPWAELAELAVLGAEFLTEEEVQCHSRPREKEHDSGCTVLLSLD